LGDGRTPHDALSNSRSLPPPSAREVRLPTLGERAAQVIVDLLDPEAIPLRARDFAQGLLLPAEEERPACPRVVVVGKDEIV